MNASPERKSLHAPLGVIGLGLVGSALAERLIRAGFTVLGCDINPARVAEFALLGGRATSAAAVFAECERVILSLPSHGEVDELIAACSAELRPGIIIVDTT